MTADIWDRVSVPGPARAMVKRLEAWSASPYDDGAGYTTIGWGSRTMPDGSPVTFRSRHITCVEGDALLDQQIAGWIAGVARLVLRPITEAQAAALVCFAHNCGLGTLETSGLLAMLNASEPIARVAGQFHLFDMVHAQPSGHLVQMLGLSRRRNMEAMVFTGSDPADAYDLSWRMKVVDFFSPKAVAQRDLDAWRGANA